MNQLEIEQEVGKMARAMMIRNSLIGKDLIADLQERLPREWVAAVLIISIERLIWLDCDSVLWSINHLIPPSIMQEIQKMTSMMVCKRLIDKGFRPGQDFSLDAEGKLLLSNHAQTVVAIPS